MRLRSLLFVPGDRPERFEKAAASGADAIILDLEDSVVLERKAFARQAVGDYLAGAPVSATRIVRINPVASSWLDADLQVAAMAQGLMLPKAEGAPTLARLDAAADGRTLPPILPIATETPLAVFRLADYAEAASRLLGLTWGAEDLPAAVDAAGSRGPDGRYTAPYEMVRSLALFAAHAAGTQAIETVYPDIRDLDGLEAYARRGAFDGFTGMMAIHPSQVAGINAAFTPSQARLDEARAVVEAFAQQPGQGAIRLGGRMLDRPHLRQAQRLLESVTMDLDAEPRGRAGPFGGDRR